MAASDIVIALMIGFLLLIPGIFLVTDFARPETYNANISVNDRTSLTNLQNQMNSTFGMSGDMQSGISSMNSSAASGSSLTGVPGNIVTQGYSSLLMLFNLPTLIKTMGDIIFALLPFNLGWLVTGIAGIVGFIFVIMMIKALLWRGDL